MQRGRRKCARSRHEIGSVEGAFSGSRLYALAPPVPPKPGSARPSELAVEPQAAMRGRSQPAICNPGASTTAPRCRIRAGSDGMPDALTSTQMKDLVLICVSVGFFALAWVYARSFDRL